MPEWPQYLLDLARQRGIPGVASGLVDADRVLWTGAAGVTSEGGTPITERTIFSVQSISKLYTSTVVMCAVRDKLLDLDAPIRTYLPDFAVNSAYEPEPATRMTLRHLLSHTAGFTHEAPLGNNYDALEVSFTEHATTICDTWLRSPVGQRYEYSNLGIDLAGLAVQAVAGMPFHEYAHRALFDPLDLTDTTFDSHAIKDAADRAVGHQAGAEQVPLHIPIVPSGGLYTSITDALRFVQFFLRDGEGLLPPALLEEQRRVPFPVRGQTHGYALGLAHQATPRLDVQGHSGGGYGFLADLYWTREHKLGGVTLANTTAANVSSVIWDAIADAAGVQAVAPPARESVKLPPERAARYAGTYVGRWDAAALELQDDNVGVRPDAAVLELRDDNLVVRFGQTTLPVEFTSEDEARVPALADFLLRIEPDRLVMLADGSMWIRNPDTDQAAGPNLLTWRTYEGDYDVESWTPMPPAHFAVRNGHACWRWLAGAWLTLTEYQPGLFFTCHGEALDLRGAEPSYANLKLRRTERLP